MEVIVTIVSKLGDFTYLGDDLQPTYIGVIGHRPVTKYQQDILVLKAGDFPAIAMLVIPAIVRLRALREAQCVRGHLRDASPVWMDGFGEGSMVRDQL